MSILIELGGSLRFDVADKTQLTEVFEAAPDFSDTQLYLPHINWKKTKKCENEVFSITSKKLDPRSDIVYLVLYLLEFRGRERAYRTFIL